MDSACQYTDCSEHNAYTGLLCIPFRFQNAFLQNQPPPESPDKNLFYNTSDRRCAKSLPVLYKTSDSKRPRNPPSEPTSAGTPESAGSSWNGFPTVQHFHHRFPQINSTSRIFICSKQRRSHHDMMLRSMHMAKRCIHHLPDNLDRISGCFVYTQGKNGVQSLRMTIITNIMPVLASGLAQFFFMT